MVVVSQMVEPIESHTRLGSDCVQSSETLPARTNPYRGFGYELREELGRGRSGVVHRAIHISTGIPVALKRLRFVNPQGLYDLKREFRTLCRGDHRGIAKVYELVADPDDTFFAMELIDGPGLVPWVRDRDSWMGNDDVVTRLVDALSQLATTLEWLHRTGRVHRDVKPSNVRVQDGRVVLLDFDLAALVGRSRSETLDSAGTLPYMPNEAIWGGQTSPAADIYALGVLAYECLTGERPFRSSDPIDLHREKSEGLPALPRAVPSWLTRLLRDMTSAEPGERPTAAGLGRDLGHRLGRDWRHAEVPEPARRQEALERLIDAYRSRDKQTPTLFCISGPSEAGKTPLINAFLGRVETDTGSCILEGRCLPTATIPFQGVDGIVDALAEMLSRCDPRESEKWVPEHVTELLELFPVLARVEVFEEAASNASRSGGPIDRRRHGFAALRSVLSAVGRSRTLIVFVDDLQWADERSLHFWADMLASRVPFVFVAVARTGEAFRALQLGEGGISVDLQLQPLDPPAAASAVRHLPTVSAGARRLLEASSLAFAAIDLTTLVEAVAVDNAALAAKELIEAGGLIQYARLDPRMTIEPHSDAVRRTVEQSLSLDERRTWHRALAEGLSGEEKDAYAVAAFWHWRAAGEQETARPFALKAGQRLMERMAFEQAAALYEAALDAAEDEDALSLTQRLGEALEASGHGKAAAEAYAIAATHAQRLNEPDLVVRQLRQRSAEAFLRAGYIIEGNAMLDQVLPGLPRMPTSNAGLLLFLLKHRVLRVLGPRFVGFSTNTEPETQAQLDGLWSATVGTVWADLSRSMYYQALHASLARHSDEPMHQARALSAEGCYLAATSPRLLGRTAERLGSASVALAEQQGDNDLIAMASCTSAATSFLRGDWATTVERCRYIDDWVDNKCTAADWELSTAYIYCAWSLGFQGDLPAIEAFRAKVLDRGRAHDDRLALTCVSVGLPNLTWLARGRPDLARAGAREAMRGWRSPSYSPFHFFALFGDTLADLYSSDAVAARGRFEADAESLHRSFLRLHPIVRPLFHYLNVTTALAALQESPGVHGASAMRRSARRSLLRLSLERAPWSQAFSQSARALWGSMYGEPDATCVRLLRAEEKFRRAGMGLYAEAAQFQRETLRGRAPRGFSLPMEDPTAVARCLLPVAIR